MENQEINNGEIEIDLGEIFRLLIGHIGIIALSGIACGLIAIIGTLLFITPQYESTTKIYVLNRQDSSTLTSQDMSTSTQLTKDYAELIQSRTVTEGVIAHLKLDMTHETLLKKLSIETSTDTRIVTIKVKDTDPYRAAEIANSVRDVAAEHIQSVMDIEAVNVVETANIPDRKASPSLSRNGIIGGLLGLLLSAVIVIAIYLTNDSIRKAEDVERYLKLSVLGTIPMIGKEKKSKRKKTRRNSGKSS